MNTFHGDCWTNEFCGTKSFLQQHCRQWNKPDIENYVHIRCAQFYWHHDNALRTFRQFVILKTSRFLHNVTPISWRWPAVIYKYVPIPTVCQWRRKTGFRIIRWGVSSVVKHSNRKRHYTPYVHVYYVFTCNKIFWSGRQQTSEYFYLFFSVWYVFVSLVSRRRPFGYNIIYYYNFHCHENIRSV